MRTTITLDDDLLAKAHEMTGIAERSTLLHDGLRLLIQREAARRLARMGGSAPDLVAAPRRRPAVASTPNDSPNDSPNNLPNDSPSAKPRSKSAARQPRLKAAKPAR